MINSLDKTQFVMYKTNSRDDMFPRRSHSHKEISLGYIEKGETLIKIKGQEFLLIAGDIVLIPADTVHMCNPVNPKVYKYHMLYLDRSWIDCHFPSLIDGFETLAIPGKEKGERLIETVLKCSKNPAVIESAFIEFFDSLLSNYCLDRSMSSPDEEILGGLHKKIVSMPEVSYHIDELASEVGMNKFSFIRMYARFYGLTPHADIINRRIQRAILLFESSMELAEIAVECGFADQSHFNKQFKLYSGLRPGEYRAAIRNSNPVV